MADFLYEDLLPIGDDTTEYRLLTTEGVSTVEGPDGRTFLQVEPEAMRLLTETALHDISHYLRTDHLTQLASILDDPEASNNDKFVALDLLKNANIAAAGVLPMCQDTGTAIVMGKRGQHVLTPGDDEKSIARGVYDAYTRLNLRYSQNAPITMWDEKNTGNNLPAQIELYADTAAGHENSYKFLFMAKGGGSANKSYLYQETKAILNPDSMMQFLEAKIRSLGTAACPPYHLAIVVGGTSAEFAMKTAKYASAHYLDELPTEGAITGRGFRDHELEKKVFELTQKIGIGAQFGGKYFCHDVRVVRLPRHGASLPVAIAVSCSADRQAKAKITPEGVFLEQLEFNPGRFLPEVTDVSSTKRRMHFGYRQGRCGQDRPHQAHGRDPRRAVQAPGEDSSLLDRSARRGTRHRARQDQRASRRRRRDAPVPQGSPGVLRRPRQDTRRYGIRFVRPDHGRPHGLVRRAVPGRRWLDDHARQGKPLQAGHRRLQHPRRFLPRIHRWTGSTPGTRLHQESRHPRVRRTGDGSRLEDRRRGLPRVHRRRRQGQRLLRPYR